jgi:hypothetical protein
MYISWLKELLQKRFVCSNLRVYMHDLVRINYKIDYTHSEVKFAYSKWAINQLYHGKNILLFDDMTVMYCTTLKRIIL